MEISETLADEAVLVELGERLTRHRLARRLTQSRLAREAGISKRTVERIESGASVQLVNLVRVLRALDLLSNLEQLLPGLRPSPLDALRLQGKERQRASTKQSADEAAPWRWADEDEAS